MNRNGWEIGGRPIATILPNPSATSLRLLPAPPAVRPFASRAPLQHHVPVHTPVRWARQTTQIATRPQPRLTPFLPQPRARSAVELAVACRSLAIQQRFKSDARRLRADKAEEAARKGSDSTSAGAKAASDGTTSSGRMILDRLPTIHRPTKEELLGAATGFWHRLQIRFKWFSIRSVRPFNSDEIGAFVSWIFWGHVLWIVIGTTTFVSLAIWAINTVFAQETLAGWVGNYLTKSSGVKIVFENAIVPTWRDGVITFNNVFVSRRPGRMDKRERSVSKGSSTTAATAAAAAAQAALDQKGSQAGAAAIDDGNYTQFDVTIDKVNVTLSFTKWFNGKGLLHDVEIRGVRGVLDRTHVFPTGEKREPKSYRHTHNLGDFEIDNFKMEDVLLTVYQPKSFRPFTVSVYNCELPRLRKQWLFYDFMSANNMSGSFDESLFTLHPRQIHGMTGAALVDGQLEDDGGQWKKHSRLRIDGLSIDHLNRGVEGPFSWIQEGNVDIVADMMIPHDEDRGIAKVMSGLYDQLEATVTSASHQLPGVGGRQPKPTADAEDLTTTTLSPSPSSSPPPPNDLLILDLRVHLNDVRASVPLFPGPHISYTNSALTRPIVAYINSRPHTCIPITCRIIKHAHEFDGSWTVFDSGLLEDLSREVYEAFVMDIRDERVRGRRMRKVGVWGLRVVAQALFLGLAGQLA
ncbi:Mitochondrial distribution and morphology protein 31, mitochondrial precursor [Friedmanniomyces endolithicus]|nr:Mitochondrial distribution and morphology protein 31, mitochondrial precursor [Friedmanniomyces endolithicus]